MAALVFTNDIAGYQQGDDKNNKTTVDDENVENNFSSHSPLFKDLKGIRIGNYICCPSSSSLMTIFMFFIIAMWLIPFLLIIILLIVCGIDTKITTAISYCGTHQHHLRPMFVATFCVNACLFSIVFIVRAFILYVKWFGWKTTNENASSSSNSNSSKLWKRLCSCGSCSCGFRLPGKREILSLPFWLIILQVFPGVVSNVLLVIMAIYPDEKATRSEHFVTAFVGLLLLVVYTGFSFIIQTWRLVRLCRGKTKPFQFVRHVNSLTSNKRRMFILSVSGFSFSIVWHLVCMIGAVICIPIYLTKFIPVAEWIAVLLILLGMVPIMLDNMLSIREGPAEVVEEETSEALLR